jgi:hypothetical protein
MENLSKEEFTALASFEAPFCVSVFIHAHRSGVEVNETQDALHLKSVLQQAEKKLAADGADQDAINNLLKEGYSLVEDRDFWNEQLDALAVLMANGFFKFIKLPFQVKEELLVDSCFYVAPLLPLIYNKHFYLLVLSRDDSTLYRGDAFGFTQINIRGLPDKLNVEPDEEGGRQFSKGTRAGNQMYEKAKAAGESDDTAYLLQGLKEADEALLKDQASYNEQPPLLLAGSDYLIENYKKISQYGKIFGETLSGNFELEEKSSLYHKAKEKLDSYFRENTQQALKTFYDNSANELTSSIPDDVIPASYYSKVSDLFVLRDEHRWGTFDEATDHPEIQDQQLNGNTCLINKAVVKTILNGGDVHVLEREKMPAESKIAAFMRY